MDTNMSITFSLDQDKQALKDQYQAAVTRLEQIINADPSGWNQATFNQQAFLAIQDMAQYELYVIKVLKRIIS